jgi:DNA-binding protein HU-beta
LTAAAVPSLDTSDKRIATELSGQYNGPTAGRLGGMKQRNDMTKADLIEKLSDRLGLAKVEAEKCVEGFLEEITGCLKRGEALKLLGFGTFKVARRKARTGRNPRTGEPLEIPGSCTAKFSQSSQLKGLLSEDRVGEAGS